MRKLYLAVGIAVGYVLGAKAGRERYEQIASSARRLKENPTMQNAAGVLQEQAEQVKDKIMHSSIGNKLLSHDEVRDSDRKPEYWETAGLTTAAARSNNDRGGVVEP
jgi:hypothetical protein